MNGQISVAERTSEAGASWSPSRRVQWIAGVVAVLCVALIVVHFHDRFWWPPDDGAYAYVALRLLRGDVLNGDVQDIHAGYVHFIHAAALKMFGEDLLSLRYPLSMLTVLQAALVYLLLLPRGPFAAFAGALTVGSLTFVQFLNPTANWYVLFVAFATIACIKWLDARSASRYIIVGFVLACAILLRQLSGIFLAMGAVAWLLAEPTEESNGRSLLARATLLLIAAGLAFYMYGKGSIVAMVMFGVWPLAAIAVIWRHLRISDGAVIRMYGLLAAGGIAAALPLVAYHVYHGTLSQWFDDAVLAALQLNGLDFVAWPSFGFYFVGVVQIMQTEPSIASILSGAYWVILLGLPIATGLLFLVLAWNRLSPREWEPATIVAIFFAPVSAHYQIPIYLMYSSCLSLLGLLFLVRMRRQICIVAVLSLMLSAVGLVLQAGQPVSRGLGGIIRGETVTLDAPAGIARASIAMEKSDAAVYSEIVAAIESHSAPSEKILSLPFDPEFYFLSDRQSEFGFIGSPFGIRNEAELAAAIEQIRADPPRVVINKRVDKYHSAFSIKLVDEINRDFRLLKSIGDFDVYVAP